MSRSNSFKVEISDELMEEIESHCFSEVSHEVGGFLVGTLSEGKTVIKGSIASTKAQSQQTSLTFTHEAWDEAYQAMAEKYTDLSLVGWYHTHPGFGVFMSEYDGFIQENFFGAAGQVGLVVDPLKGKSGWFRWHNKEVRQFMSMDTKREGLGGEAVDHVVIPKANSIKTSTPTSPKVVVGATMAALVTALLGFFIGQQGSGGGDEQLQAQLMQYQLINSSLEGELAAPLVMAPQKDDPAGTTFFIRHELTAYELQIQDWANVIAIRFGTTVEKLKAANATVDFTKPAPEYVVVPIQGWKVIPAPLPTATPSPEPTSTPTASTPAATPSSTGSAKPSATTKPTATTKPSTTGTSTATPTATEGTPKP